MLASVTKPRVGGPSKHATLFLTTTTSANGLRPRFSTLHAVKQDETSLAPSSSPAPSTTNATKELSPLVDIPPRFANLVRKPTFPEANICRLYYFTKPQQHVFEELVESMKSCRTALTAVALSSILLSLVPIHGHEHSSAAALTSGGITVGDVAYWGDSLMVAFLINYAMGPFQQVMKSRSNQMAYCFQGVNRLSLVFQQIFIGSIAVSTVTALEAAVLYPPLVVGTSAVFFGVAVVRSAAMWWTLSKHTVNNEEVIRTLDAIRDPEHSSYAQQMTLLDRWMVFLAFGYLLQYEDDLAAKEQPATATASPTSSVDGPSSALIANSLTNSDGSPQYDESSPKLCLQHYEFNSAEERVLRGLTEAASTTGLALSLQAFVTLILTVANFGVGDFPDVVGNGINATNKAIMATILFNACASYDRALHTVGDNDVQHLMEGLGKKGLTGLFESLAVLSWAITIATLASLALPVIEENVLAKAGGDVLSHRGAEVLIEALNYARAIFRSV